MPNRTSKSGSELFIVDNSDVDWKVRGKRRGLTVRQGGELRREHARSVVPLQALAEEARRLERRVAELVNEAYGLTPEEVALMWHMAPPRMPGEPPCPVTGTGS
jgi:hypothetical protein